MKLLRLSHCCGWLICLAVAMMAGPTVSPGQQALPLAPGATPTGAEEPATNQDHQQMMAALGIKRLRPKRGPANKPNYDPAKANPFPDLPDPLTLRDGRRVTDPQMWWSQRRPEIVEDFEREIYGRVPSQVPKVTWSVVTQVTDGQVGNLRANGKQLVGHVDNSACPTIAVDIRMTLVTPADAKGPVPVLIMIGRVDGSGLPRATDSTAPENPSSVKSVATGQLLAAGWGYALLDFSSIQADNAAGLSAGIIGLVNRGGPRRPDDWGALRAWAWGASRALDELETDPAVDGRKVGVEGVSRFGKAALVAMAFDQRFAAALIGSSGEGGAKLHRRDFGEAVENLTSPDESYWMAGNFLKYGAADASGGSRNAGDLPVDAHELIALCAPRLTFISYGSPEHGDSGWCDQQGSFMAAVAAGPVFRLLGARDLGVSEDYREAKMPPVCSGLLEGDLAWREHDGGHEDRSNLPSFLQWASARLHVQPISGPNTTPAE